MATTVPTYSLYGVTAEERLAEQVHCESIAERSRLHAWEIKPHRHEQFFQLIFIRKGEVQVRLDDQRLALCGGHRERQCLCAGHGRLWSRPGTRGA